MVRETWKLGVQGDLVLVVETATSPTDEEWDAFVKLLNASRERHHMVRVLVLTEGGGPDSAQRQKIVKSGWENSKYPVAVVTGNAILRGVLTAFRWFNVNIRGFAPDRVADAVRFLEITPEQLQWARDIVPKMRAELGMKAVTVWL